MATEVGRVRVRLPSAIRGGDAVQVRALVIHPQERLDVDKQGRVIARAYRYVRRVSATYLGRTVFAVELTQSVSENPYVTFTFRATAPGELRVIFEDTAGGRWEGSAAVAFGG